MLPLGGTWLTPPLQLAGTVAVIVDNGIFDSLAQPIPSCTVGLSSPLPNWDNSHTYSAGNGVLFGGHSYVSANNANTGHQPDSSPSWWVLARPQIDDDYGISQTPQTRS